MMSFPKNLALFIVVLFSSTAVAALVFYFFKFSLFIIPAAIIFFGLVFAIFKNPVLGVLIIAFLLPFERIGSFDLGGITIRGSQIFALITLFSWLFAFLTKRVNFQIKNPLLVPVFFFFGASVISMVNAQNFSRSISVFLFNAFVILVSLMLPCLISDKKILIKIIYVILASAFVVSLFGLYQFLGDVSGLPPELTGLREQYTKSVFGFPRVQSTALEPLYFANFLLIPIALCLSLLLSKNLRSLKKNIFLISLLALSCVSLILTLSRGAYLAFGALMILFFLIYFKSFFSLKRLLILGLIGVVAAFSVLGFLKFTGKEKNIGTFLKQAAAFQKGVAVKERETTYATAWKMIEEQPILGFGPGSFGPYAAVSFHVQPKEGWLITNNLFLEIWAEEGIFGLASFTALIFILILRTLKAWQTAHLKKESFLKALLLGLFVAFLSILVQYQTFSILYILHFWFLIGLLLTAQNLIMKEDKENLKTAT